MGLIISFQSVVGFAADLIFPRILKSVRVRRLVFWTILTSALTSFFLTASTFAPYIAIFVITMTLWGIYYELINFANYQFMGSVVPVQMRAGAWGFAGIFVNLAYFLGPFIAAQFLLHGVFLTQGTIIIFLVVSLVLLTLTKKMHDAPTQVKLTDLNPFTEFKHWMTLSTVIWPVLIISLVMGIIDATFYTVGTVWTEKLTMVNPWGVWFLPLYSLPCICLGIPLSNWEIVKGKKKLLIKLMGLSGIIFMAIAFSDSVPWQLLIVGLASSVLAISYPLLQGVYSDIIARMGQEKKGMIGLTSSFMNISYIIWPVFAGLIASRVGERLTFSYLGGGVLVVSIILLLATPKKLKLPQGEIKSWHQELTIPVR